MNAEFNAKGRRSYRLISGTTIMRRENLKLAKEEQKEANRVARLKERQEKKYEGMGSLFNL